LVVSRAESTHMRLVQTSFIINHTEIHGLLHHVFVKKKINGSGGKCLRAGFLTPVEGKRDRWGG
jgi:hypothetical protein